MVRQRKEKERTMETQGKKTWEINKRKYVLDYQKYNYSSVVLHFNRKYEADIIEALAKLPNKNQYIKELIRKDLGLK